MHSPICYAVIKQEGYELPDLEDFKNNIPDEETIMDYVPESDWCVANVNDETLWHRGVASPEDLLHLLSLDGLTNVKFTDDTKQWIKMTITQENALARLQRKTDIERKYLDVVEKGIEHGVIVDSLISTKQYPDVFTEDDAQICLQHYNETSTYGGLRIFTYEHAEWADGDLLIDRVLKDANIIETIHYELNKYGVYQIYVATGITGDYHF